MRIIQRYYEQTTLLLMGYLRVWCVEVRLCIRQQVIKDVAGIMEKYKHKLFRRGVWATQVGPWGEDSRKLTDYTTERVTFLIILEVLLTAWNSDYFFPFLQYHYRLTRTLTSVPTQTDLSRTDGWSRYFIPFETCMPKGITQYMYDRGYFLNFYSSWIIYCFSLVSI